MWVNVLILAAAAGQTQTASVAIPQKPMDAWNGFGAFASLDNYVGVGTFVPGRSTDNPYYASWLTLTPAYALTEDLQLSLSLIFVYEWTYFVTPCHAASGPRAAGAPSEDCSDTDDRLGRRGDMVDFPLSITHWNLFTAGPFTLSGSGRVWLPTSRYSRATNTLFSFGGSTTGRFDFAPAFVTATVSFAKFFPTAEAGVLDAEEVAAKADGGVPSAQCASFRTESCLPLSGFATSWFLQASVTAGTTIPWVDGLRASVTLGYWYQRRYGRDPDRFTSPSVDADGNAIVTGVNHGDTTSGTIDVTYWFDDHVAASVGVFSLQPARTADGRGLRFPFYDFVSPARNYTAWYLSGSYRL